MTSNGEAYIHALAIQLISPDIGNTEFFRRLCDIRDTHGETVWLAVLNECDRLERLS